MDPSHCPACHHLYVFLEWAISVSQEWSQSQLQGHRATEESHFWMANRRHWHKGPKRQRDITCHHWCLYKHSDQCLEHAICVIKDHTITSVGRDVSGTPPCCIWPCHKTHTSIMHRITQSRVHKMGLGPYTKPQPQPSHADIGFKPQQCSQRQQNRTECHQLSTGPA